jgi:hypothetical protein
MNDDFEQQLAEMDRIEKLKGPRNPSRAQQYFEPTLQPQAAEELERLEALKRARPVLPKPERDFIADKRDEMVREARHERIKAATGGRIR